MEDLARVCGVVSHGEVRRGWPGRRPDVPRLASLVERAELVLPGAGELPAACASAASGAAFERVTLEPHLLLDEAFLDAHVRTGRLEAAAARADVERGNGVFVTAGGRLVLLLDARTYRELGLEGPVVRGAFGERRRVEVDMSRAAFRPGAKLYDRVRWCLEGRVPPLDLVAAWTDADGREAPIRWPGGAAAERVGMGGAAIEDLGAGVAVPDAGAVARHPASACEWLGLVAGRLSGALRTVAAGAGAPQAELELCGRYELEALRPSPGRVRVVALRGGIVAPGRCARCVSAARAAVDSGAAPFAAVVLWHARGAPRTWGGPPARGTGERQRQTVVLLLPGGRCDLLGLG